MLNHETAVSDTHADPTLFSMIRTRYQDIVEEILKNEQVVGVANATMCDFRAKHRSGTFFCRHRTCSRAAQGYNTPEMRQMHEQSHVPNFQCAEVACGFFGRPFNTQAAFKKHIIQYHDEVRTASIPDSLDNAHCRSHKDRSLFTLTKPKQKRRVEESYSPQINLPEPVPHYRPGLDQSNGFNGSDKGNLRLRQQLEPREEQRQRGFTDEAVEGQIQNGNTGHGMPNGGSPAQYQQARAVQQNPNAQPQQQVHLQSMYFQAHLKALAAERHNGNEAAITPQEKHQAMQSALRKGKQYFAQHTQT